MSSEQRKHETTETSKIPITLEHTLPFETVAVDFITKLPQSGKYNTIMTATCHDCSKAAIMIPCQESITAEEVARLYLKHIYVTLVGCWPDLGPKCGARANFFLTQPTWYAKGTVQSGLDKNLGQREIFFFFFGILYCAPWGKLPHVALHFYIGANHNCSPSFPSPILYSPPLL